MIRSSLMHFCVGGLSTFTFLCLCKYWAEVGGGKWVRRPHGCFRGRRGNWLYLPPSLRSRDGVRPEGDCHVNCWPRGKIVAMATGRLNELMNHGDTPRLRRIDVSARAQREGWGGRAPGKSKGPRWPLSPNVRNQNLVCAALHHQQTVIHLWLHYRAVWELNDYFLPSHNGKWHHSNRRCDNYSSQEMFFCSIFLHFLPFIIRCFLSCLVSSYLPRLFMCPTRVLLSPFPPLHKSSRTPMTSNFNLS